MTTSEKVVWEFLRKSRRGFRWRRQYPLRGFVLDFYCPESKVCLEIDGPMHSTERDSQRDSVLRELSIETIRMPTTELFGDEVVDGIERWLESVTRACEARAGRSAFPDGATW